jgi:hypothetical protein
MWTHKNTFGIGGLENIGYAPKQDYLMVLSSQGQGIFDCIAGEKIAQLNNDSDWWQNFNQETNSIKGFDILDKTEISTCGLFGQNNLLKSTSDGWTLTVSNPEPDDKPFEMYLVQKIHLVSPDKKEKIFITKDGPCELRAFGFSETGKSLIVALSCDLTIYSRT